MRSKPKRSHSESQLDRCSKTKKRWKKGKSPETMQESFSVCETSASSKMEGVFASSSSSASPSSSAALSRHSIHEDEIQLASPSSSIGGEDSLSPPMLTKS